MLLGRRDGYELVRAINLLEAFQRWQTHRHRNPTEVQLNLRDFLRDRRRLLTAKLDLVKRRRLEANRFHTWGEICDPAGSFPEEVCAAIEDRIGRRLGVRDLEDLLEDYDDLEDNWFC